jgi:RNA polymerase sigma factor (sigma-70 family)
MSEVVAKVKLGDDDAVRAIWDRYFPQVVRLAGQRLADQPRRAVDEEDVAISVMESFFRAASAGRFPDLQDSDGIWRLLSAMIRRKVVDQVRRNATRPIVGESAIPGDGLESMASRDPTPAMLAIVKDEMEHLLTVLPEQYHQVALKKLECCTAPEIAQACGVHVSTVERRLRIIREFWARESDSLD